MASVRHGTGRSNGGSRSGPTVRIIEVIFVDPKVRFQAHHPFQINAVPRRWSGTNRRCCEKDGQSAGLAGSGRKCSVGQIRGRPERRPRPTNRLSKTGNAAGDHHARRRRCGAYVSLSASSAVRWLQRWRDTGSARAKLSGGSTSPLEEHVEWLLALVAEQPDLTLDEIVAAMRKQRIPGSRTAVWRFFERHNVTVKKKPARDGARTGGRGAGAAALDSQARPA